ncbi:Methyltransferase domain protein [Flavobacterium columnare]|uniref:FkbM family methyltransferase n=2 Tax=Flavobacterium TaxID=237 RepID=A0ABW8PQR5_9FLAO|nr:FkbM family methyltransferase [Flavobacterium columnare]SPE78550.1 Methyltransferase domain protein [Flavobacterium columnare]
MIYILKKIIKRFQKFKEHPVTKSNPYGALFRYLLFNLGAIINNKPKVYRWVNGLKFYAQKGDAGIVPNIYFKLFDYEDSMFVINNISSQDVFVDIGANVGHFSLLAANNGAQVYAFEPIKETFEKLKRNVELNILENVELYNVGVGNKNEFLNFTTNKDVMNSVALDNEAEVRKIKVLVLDEVLINVNPTMLKIDVEGYELFVLQGADQILKAPSLKYILIEINNSSTKFNVEDEVIHDTLLLYGFKPCKYDVVMNKMILIETFRKDKFNTLYIR